MHSKLRMPGPEMTRRMVTAIANPHVDVLGHCTGRVVRAGGARGERRPESAFDAEIVFEACRSFGVAVEINCRPDRLDPPKRLLRLAYEAGLRLRHRHRRARAGPAGLAAVRVRAGGAVRDRAGADRQHLAAGGAAGLDEMTLYPLRARDCRWPSVPSQV